MFRKHHIKKLNYIVPHQLLFKVQRNHISAAFPGIFLGGKKFFLIAHFVSHSFGKLYLWIKSFHFIEFPNPVVIFSVAMFCVYGDRAKQFSLEVLAPPPALHCSYLLAQLCAVITFLKHYTSAVVIMLITT